MNAFWATHAAHRQRGDLESATRILAEDCILLQPFQPPVAGRESITRQMKEALTRAEIHRVSFESQEVYHHGDWLVDFGTFSETFSLDGTEERQEVGGSYSALLRLDADGEWKVKRFMAMPSNSLGSP